MPGDGINDALALEDTDVGILVDTGMSITKESADIILFKKNLMVLEENSLRKGKRLGISLGIKI
ncbi:Mg2+ transport protein [Xenorhabdus beddingii]|uniref:Mg2+ transport protein n=1 Tax=Xenorhabdus beddingii TaxID=40578 RepID=A0A1Y2SSF9_9GAMM|nr:hypothetical protein [Xenorhabdus beddingii]OTA21132.1 Mg2+ transport protein [Xenorhabdus beddingii]